MTTPVKPVPRVVARWMARVRWFRWHDAFVAWAGLWGLGAAVLGRRLAGAAAVLPLILVGLSLVVRPLRGNDQLQSRDLQPMPDPAGEVTAER